MKLASAAIMIRPRYLPDSIIAQLVSVSAFSHSLDSNRKLLMLPEKLLKIGVKVVRHGRFMTFQLAEVAISDQTVLLTPESRM